VRSLAGLWSLSLLVLVAACAAPGGRPSIQTVLVETPGAVGARCELSNDRGQWVVTSTPGTVTLETSKQPLRVACRTESGATGRAGATSSADRTSGTGALTGGIVAGAAVGSAAGASTLVMFPPLGAVAIVMGAAAGAMAGDAIEGHKRELRYPDRITIGTSRGSSAWQSPGGVALGLGVRGLTSTECRQRGLDLPGAALVTALVESGAARAAGVEVGDIVLAAGGAPVADAADVEQRMRELPFEAPLELVVWRGGRTVGIVLARAAAGS
jgi:hypothetical protein